MLRKLSDEDKVSIFSLYINTSKTQHDIAFQYGINQCTVNIILNDFFIKKMYAEKNNLTLEEVEKRYKDKIKKMHEISKRCIVDITHR